MEYIDVKSASEKWGISPRRIRKLCEIGRVDGAVHNGWYWIIPSSSPKPSDGRVLRKSKALDIHPGRVDVDAFNVLKEKYPLKRELLDSDKFKSAISHVLNILLSLDEWSLKSVDIFSILSGNIVPSLTLKEHLLVVNFYSLLVSFLDNDKELSEREMKDLYTRLLQGVKDENGEYRDGSIKKRGSDMSLSVSEKIESFFFSYKRSYSRLYSVSSSVIFSGEMEITKPYLYLSHTFVYLLQAFILLKDSILPPFVSVDIIEEAKASFSLVKNRGNYTNLTSLHERMINRMYKEVFLA